MGGDIKVLLDLLAIVSPLVAVAGYVHSTRRDRDHEAREMQRISDQLEAINARTSETNAMVKELSKQLADHSVRLERMETRWELLSDRVGRLEQRCDSTHAVIGGTD